MEANIDSRITGIEGRLGRIENDIHELKAGQKFIYWAFGIIVVLNLSVFTALLHIGLSALSK